LKECRLGFLIPEGPALSIVGKRGRTFQKKDEKMEFPQLSQAEDWCPDLVQPLIFMLVFGTARDSASRKSEKQSAFAAFFLKTSGGQFGHHCAESLRATDSWRALPRRLRYNRFQAPATLGTPEIPVRQAHQSIC
jgi:hypothetical protein